MALRWTSVAGFLAVAGLTACGPVDAPAGSDTAQVQDESIEVEGDPPDGVEYEADWMPSGYQEGPVDTDRDRTIGRQIDAYLKTLGERAGSLSITPDRAGYRVPIVDLSDEEAAAVAAFSTDEITVTATQATLSEAELETIAVRLVEHLDDSDAAVKLHTDLELVVVSSPEALSEPERSRLRSLVDEVLDELMGARESRGLSGSSPVTSEEVLAFERGATVPLPSG